MLNKLSSFFLIALLLSSASCASRGDFRLLRSDISKIWDELDSGEKINEAQSIRLTRVERSVIELSMPDDLLFKTGSAKLDNKAVRLLEKMARVLSDYEGVKLWISGHTDSVGSTRGNLRLSQKRADAVAGVLYEEGFAQENIHTQGVGEGKPIASNATAEGRKENRRVTISIYPDTSPDV
jgi:outer membrane protein OmpA-like peptidoglycan-associated protein